MLPHRDGDGNVERFLVVANDTTKRRRADDTLRQIEERFHKVFDHSNDAIFVIDIPQNRILEANSKVFQMLGYSRKELLSTPISAIHPKEMSKLRTFAESVFQEGSGWTDELTCLTKSGQTLPAEISASPFAVGDRTCLLALVRDITKRSLAEKALRESKERLAGIIGSAMDAIVILDQDRVIRLLNTTAEDVFGCQEADVRGPSFDRFASDGLRDHLTRRVTALHSSGLKLRYRWAPMVF